MKRRCEKETRSDGTFFWIARAGLLAATLLPVGCHSGTTNPPQAGEVPYSGGDASNVQEALDQIQAHLAQLDQTVADLSEQVAALKGTRQPVPTGPTDARDVRWRTAEGQELDVATALENTTSQLADLATQVSTLQATLADQGNSISELEAHHECPPGAIRFLDELNEGVCMDLDPSPDFVDSFDAHTACFAKGGRLCTAAELDLFDWAHLDTAQHIGYPAERRPELKPYVGSAEWVWDTQNTKRYYAPGYEIQRLYRSWNISDVTNNPMLDQTFPKLPYRCCYDR